MKRLKNTIVIIVIFLVFYYMANQALLLNISSELPWNLSYMLRSIFVDLDRGVKEFVAVDYTSVSSYFFVLLISFYLYSVSFYKYSKNYRPLVIGRYKDKRTFLNTYKLLGAKITFCLALLIGISVLVSFYLINGSIGRVTIAEGLVLILQVVNIFIYFNICVISNMYLVLKYNEIISAVVILMATAMAIVLDIYVERFSMLCYGTVSNYLMGMALLVCAYGALSILLSKMSKKMDLL